MECAIASDGSGEDPEACSENDNAAPGFTGGVEYL